MVTSSTFIPFISSGAFEIMIKESQASLAMEKTIEILNREKTRISTPILSDANSEQQQSISELQKHMNKILEAIEMTLYLISSLNFDSSP